MNQQERVEHTKRIYQKIKVKIGEISPTGLGRWKRTWEMVEGPSDAFLDTLDVWVREDTPETRRAVQDAGDGLLWAWSNAGDLYRLQETTTGPGGAGE
jgi:hypothetical protein